MEIDDEEFPLACCSRKRALISDDDEVLQEIDVYVSKKFANSLYLLQYPLRPDDISAANTHLEHKTVQFKPKQCKLEIKCEMNIQSRNYDKSRGEQLAINCSSNDKNSKSVPIFKKMMDHQIYVNDNIGGILTNCYAIGYLIDGALHLNPLHQIMQMKPSFHFLDAADEKSKTSQVNASSGGGGDSSQDEELEVVQAVRVKFAAATSTDESEGAKKRRAASYSYMQKTMDEEKLVVLEYKPFEEQDKNILNRMLRCSEKEDTDPSHALFSGDTNSLMRLFIPKADEEQGGVLEIPSDTISLTQLRTLPLPDQVQALMTNVKVIQYRQLISLLPGGADQQIILKSLQNCAILVQGCWAVKSEILYPRHMISPKSGATGETLCKIRDFVLYKFHQNSIVDKKEITNALKVQSEDLADILKQLSKLKYQKGWQFLFDTDKEFLTNNPDVAQRQNAFWEAKYQTLCHQLNLRQRTRSGQQQSGSRTRRLGSSRSGSEIFSGEEEKPTLGAKEPCLRSPTVSADRSSPSKPHSSPTKNRPFGLNATNIEELNKEFRKFLYEKLSDKPALPLSEIKRLLLLRLAESPPGNILSKGGISDRLIDQCATELGVFKIHTNKMKEPTYAYAEVGSWPEARRVLIKLLTEKLRIRFKNFKDACTNAVLEPLPNDADLRIILNDYCSQKNKLFSLIGT